jgi:hypothetical protein
MTQKTERGQTMVAKVLITSAAEITHAYSKSRDETVTNLKILRFIIIQEVRHLMYWEHRVKRS